VLLVFVAIGCGEATVDEATPAERLALPRLDESPRVTVLEKAKPAALVWIGPTGDITIGKPGKAWRGDIASTSRDVVPIADVRRTVLQAIVDGGGPRAEDARFAFRKLEAELKIAGRRLRRGARTSARDLVLGGNPNPLLPAPGRLPAAEVVDLAGVDHLVPLVIAAPSAPASTLARVLHETGGVLAVDHLGKLAALDLAFEREHGRTFAGSGAWLEVFTDAAGLHLVAMPSGTDTIVPWIGTALDRATIRLTYRKLDLEKVPIDVLVRDDTTTQTLVDILAALAAAGIRPAAVVAGPAGAEARKAQLEAARSGRRLGLPEVTIGTPSAIGVLDTPTIRFSVNQHLTQIRYCHERQVTELERTATIVANFTVAQDGSVTKATATGFGIDSDVSSCVATVIRGLEFPTRTSGGAVEVMVPLQVEPAP
jgi:hypothetical protein